MGKKSPELQIDFVRALGRFAREQRDGLRPSVFQELVRHLEALGTPTRVFVVGERATLDRLPGDVHGLEVGRIAEGLACL